MAMLSDTESDPSYYAILNVSREASADEIKRAYKSLAQVFHPDKHLDDDLRDKAQEAFSKLQEAYEVLSDPQKRDVYDVYGKEGLSAGLSVGTKLKSTDELRKEWEAFKAQQQRAREEAMAHHRGIYVCRCGICCAVLERAGFCTLFMHAHTQCKAQIIVVSCCHCADATMHHSSEAVWCGSSGSSSSSFVCSQQHRCTLGCVSGSPLVCNRMPPHVLKFIALPMPSTDPAGI